MAWGEQRAIDGRQAYQPNAKVSGIHKSGEQPLTTGPMCLSAQFSVGLSGRNTLSLLCHLSCEPVQLNLSTARFVGECLSDMYSFIVDACVGMYTHDARAHARWHDCSCMLSPSAIWAQGESSYHSFGVQIVIRFVENVTRRARQTSVKQ